MNAFGSPATLIEFKIAPDAPPEPVILNEISAEFKAAVGLPGGITSRQASSLHSNGEITTELSVEVEACSSEKVAVKLIALPFAGSETPINVCGDTSPTTDIEAIPSPERSNVPIKGASENVTEISAVKVSSKIFEGVPLSLQTDSLDDEISEIAHWA